MKNLRKIQIMQKFCRENFSQSKENAEEFEITKCVIEILQIF